jgi:predicted kinase
MKKELRIIRGIAGSGKTFLAQKMKDEEGAVVFSNDDLLMVDGVYRWDEDRALQAHWTNQRLVAAAMREEVPLIVLDNCNLLPYHSSPYVRLGKYYGYEHAVVQIATPWCLDIDELVKRNIHGIPKHILEKMKDTLLGLPLEALNLILDCEIAMDPEVTLRLAQTFIEEGKHIQADEQMMDYEDWRRIGGAYEEWMDYTAESINNKLEDWRSNQGADL